MNRKIFISIKKIVNRIFIVLFVFLITLTFVNANIVLNAATPSDLYNDDEKIYTNVSIDEEFDDDSVLVVMKKSISEVNKEYDMKFFGDFPRESIVDLTYIPGGVTENTNINLDKFTQILQIELPIHSKQNVLGVIRQLEEIDEILWAGPNHIESAEKQPISASTPSSGTHRYPSLWGLHDSVGIQAEQAWDFTTGNDNIRVGVIDSGMFNHNDISGNMSTDGGDFVNMMDEANNIPGPLRADPDGHGTHVSGTIGATGTNPNGITGVAWNVELVPLQVSYWDTNKLGWMWDLSAVIRAITWAMNNDIDIINYSGGGKSNNIAIRNAMNNFNGLFVVAAGNGGIDSIGDNNDVDRYYPSDYSRGQEFSGRVISVGAYERVIGTTTNNVVRCGFSNFGEQSVSIFAPGKSILSTLPSTISSIGYGSWGGTSMATPHVTGTAVLLWDILENSGQDLTRREIAERIKIAIINSAVTNDVGTPLNNLSVSDGRLNAYNAVKYVLENYMNPTTYTLSNYSSIINTNKTITSDASYFDELNGFYKLNVTYAKSYEFISSSTSEIEVTLYDEDFTEIPFNDLDSTNNKVHFIESLSSGTYYLKTKYANEESTGTINTQIVSRTTAYIGVGDNDVLLNTHNYNEGIYLTNYYYYINSSGVGFYRFTLTGVKADGTTVTYPYNSIVIKDHMNEDIIDKYSLTGYSNQAISGYNENTFVAYLNASGYFYVHIDIDTDGLKSLTLNIEPVESETIDLFTKSESTNSIMEILDSETTKGDYAKKIILKQAGKFTVNYSYSGSQSSDILFVLGKLNYNSTTQKYTIETLISQLMDAENDSFTYTLGLTDGTYFVAYFNKDDNAAFDVTFNRLVTQYGGNVLIPDPDSVTDGGSQVEVYEKDLSYYEVSYGGTNIVIGFTRVIYLDYHYVTQSSRYDYYWYSSNISIATVSQHGTVFGKSAGTVKIMAVNKDDPSIAFVKQFTIVQDTKTYSEVIYSEFSDTHKLSDGKYRLGLNVQNSPYPMVQYYSWRIVSKSSTITSVSIDQWGNVTIIGTGNVVIEGYDYIYNNNYGVRINLTVTN